MSITPQIQSLLDSRAVLQNYGKLIEDSIMVVYQMQKDLRIDKKIVYQK